MDSGSSSSSKKRKADDDAGGGGDGSVVEVEQHSQEPELDGGSVLKLLEPLDRDAMHAILYAACMHHPALLTEVRRCVDRDPANRKLFVRGLGWDTSADTLKSVFSHFGELEEAVVIRDKATQKSRGFGFVTFRHMDGAIRALKEPSKRIDGRLTACQFASASASGSSGSNRNFPPPLEDVSARKIYVGNVPVGITPDKVLAIFSQFGDVAEGPLGFDRTTGVSKGFALIIYRTSEGARKALLDPFKTIDGHQVHCKLAAEGLMKQQAKQEVMNDHHHLHHQHQHHTRPLMLPVVAFGKNNVNGQQQQQQLPPLVNYHYAPPPSRPGMYSPAPGGGASYGGQAGQSHGFYGNGGTAVMQPGYGVTYSAGSVPSSYNG